MKKILLIGLMAWGLQNAMQAQENVADKVIWVIGDDAILLSDVENMRLQMQTENQEINGDPYCAIPEQIAVQKLFLHQAKIDSIDIPDAGVFQYAESRLNEILKNFGTVEKFEEQTGKTVNQYREELRVWIKERQIAQQVQKNLIKDLKVTPSEVRTYFNRIPQDSLPYIPATVEVEILTFEPKIPIEEIDDIKRRLREYTEQITKGEKTFAAIARLYSADKGTAIRGGETGFRSKAEFDTEFAAAAFELNDTRRVSRIVESEFGYHIIQLVEKRGDRINVRHILLKPYVAQEDLQIATQKLDTLRDRILEGKESFEDAAFYYSYDKTTRNNKGLMVNNPRSDNPYMSERTGTSKFEMEELPPEIGKAVDTLKVNEISKPFVMLNDKGKEIAAIVKLKTRTPGHKASLTEDFQALKSMVEEHKQEEIIRKWLKKKISETYIRINDNWKNCDFEYEGWVQK
jgi:peptidyl-prolyl cis-trans isomerase SurA